jgi:hypothetical protein
MPKADNTAALLEATARRHERTVRSAQRAIRELNAAGAEITVAGVAKRAGVARSFLYRHRGLRAQIEELRPASRAKGRAAVPATERASRASIDKRLTVALDDNRSLRDQLQQAENELANLRAEIRRLRVVAAAKPPERPWPSTEGLHRRYPAACLLGRR